MYLWGSCYHTILSAEHQIQWKISILLVCIFLETESIIATCWKNMPISDYLCCYFECFQFSWRRSPWLLGDWKPLHEQILPGEIQNLDHIMTVAVMFTRGWLDWISLDGVRSENLKVLSNNHDEYVDDRTKMKNASSRQSRDQKVRQCCQMQFWGHHLLLSCSRSFRCFSFFSCMHHIFFGCMRKYWISFRGCFVFVAWASLDFFQMLFLIFVVVG